jgi:hypothetical protein
METRTTTHPLWYTRQNGSAWEQKQAGAAVLTWLMKNEQATKKTGLFWPSKICRPMHFFTK